MCAIQRPLDSATHFRVVLESEAILGILTLCESGQIQIISSDALVYETERNPWPLRKEYALAVLSKAIEHIRLTKDIEQRAKDLNRLGVKPLDALHLAMAEAGKVDYFCTCDDQLLKRSKRIQDLKVKVVSPLELVEELEK
ncbi:MAG: PIN domain-containing protein [Ardenticatenia bacterium]|nr:MAG: PIN domain-containing protein [Ardenticatenia bacterium]